MLPELKQLDIESQSFLQIRVDKPPFGATAAPDFRTLMPDLRSRPRPEKGRGRTPRRVGHPRGSPLGHPERSSSGAETRPPTAAARGTVCGRQQPVAATAGPRRPSAGRRLRSCRRARASTTARTPSGVTFNRHNCQMYSNYYDQMYHVHRTPAGSLRG